MIYIPGLKDFILQVGHFLLIRLVGLLHLRVLFTHLLVRFFRLSQAALDFCQQGLLFLYNTF